MKHLLLTLALISNLFIPINANAQQSKIVGGGCDGCELMYIGMPNNLSTTDNSPTWDREGEKITIRGIVFKQDAKTPAKNIIIYYWQTDSNGHYPTREGMDKRTKRHGYIRGWVKTDSDGTYQINTTRPISYPGSVEPAHIHLSVKEPNIKDEYYIDDMVFDDDPLLDADERKYHKNRGGSGILKLEKAANKLIAERNIILGLNIPNYP